MIDENEAAGTNPLQLALRIARKLAVTVIGMTVLIFGIALIVLPGPAFIVIPAGLAILANEYVWARRLLRYLKLRAARAARAIGGSAGSPNP